MTFTGWHARALVQGLIDLGMMSGSVDGIMEQQSYRDYYMHATSHWLGLDVHDCGPYRDDRGQVRLRPGMVLYRRAGALLRPPGKAGP